MKTIRHHKRSWRQLIVSSAALFILSSGCVGVRPKVETAALEQQQTIAKIYRPDNQRPALPTLTSDTPLSDYLLYAILNQPGVEAAYYDWAAAVQRIAVERSLPDPRLTFSADIASMVMSLMPGLMMDFPGPGKLKAAANIATAESDGKYVIFEMSVLQTAYTLKKAYYSLYFLHAKVGVYRETLRLIEEIEKLARMQNKVGKVTLQDVLRAQIELEQITTEIQNLEDSRNPLLEQFKAALGLSSDHPAPPLPRQFESTPLEMTTEGLFATALTRNPRLRELEAEVRRADAALQLTYKARVPDFNLGLSANVKPSPMVINPNIGMTLPIWRDKISAQIAAAQAVKKATEARLSAEQIALAVDYAEKSFIYRESSRNLGLLADRLLPMARQSLEVAQSSYVSNKVDFLNVLDAERTLLEFQLSEIEARIQRELALAELSLLILGMPPAGAPILHPYLTP